VSTGGPGTNSTVLFNAPGVTSSQLGSNLSLQVSFDYGQHWSSALFLQYATHQPLRFQTGGWQTNRYHPGYLRSGMILSMSGFLFPPDLGVSLRTLTSNQSRAGLPDMRCASLVLHSEFRFTCTLPPEIDQYPDEHVTILVRAGIETVSFTALDRVATVEAQRSAD
jgi:hypothetical protein